MSPAVNTEQKIRFGVFEVSPHSGELRKAGARIKLQVQPFKVLILDFNVTAQPTAEWS
jgi:hypothetical protein